MVAAADDDDDFFVLFFSCFVFLLLPLFLYCPVSFFFFHAVIKKPTKFTSIQNV